ncbi:MAG: peptide chain release factor N(5)-glutamine methyltransferase [Eubacteriales bacterium]|nr:peptide chain release factor N(5)-glutamine methyltransferase [Eubacteriales bacterium]
MTVAQALQDAYALLAQVPDGKLDAQWLLSHVLGVKRLALTLMQDQPLSAAQEAAFTDYVTRRAKREPLQYILGSAHFMGRRFVARPGVLIPRDDTETLAQMAISRVKPGDRVLDLCCGSGNLAIAIKLACPKAEIWASDVSQEAVILTRENARQLGAEITVAQGDLFNPLRGQRFDVIVSNPPYIPAGELPGLQAEVGFEPALALSGGEDGLSFYRAIIREAPHFLAPGGFLMLEVGDGQAEALHALLPPGFAHWQMARDLSGLLRAAETRRKDYDAGEV